MASRRIFIPNTGFTLIEILIVVGLFSMIGAFVLFIDPSSYFSNAFQGEERTLITMLQSARADAMDNVGQAPHGLAIYPADHPHSYVLFSGDSYASDPSSRRVIDAQYGVAIAGSAQEIIFDQLSGNANFDGTLTLTDPNRGLSYDITINHEGTISW